MERDAPTNDGVLQAARARLAASEQGCCRMVRTVEFVQPDGAIARQEFVVVTTWLRPLGTLRVEWGERAEAAGGLLVRVGGREVIVATADEVLSWPLGAEKGWRCTSLASAVAEDGGGGAALMASLLRPEEFAGATRLGAATDPAAAPLAATWEGVSCWQVALVRPLDGGGSVAQQAWFEQPSLALRQLVEQQELGGGRLIATSRIDEERTDSTVPGEASFAIGPPGDTLRVVLAGTEVSSGAAAAGAGAFAIAAAALAIALLLRRRRRA